MGAYSRTYSLTDGTTAYGSQVAFELDALGSSVNNIVDAQISSGASISDSKLAQITTASKVSGAALTSLASIPSGAGVIPAANVPFGTAASQAEMEAGSSLLVPVTPGRTQYHPGVAKAWVKFDGTGTPAASVSYNFSSITDHGTGDYSVNFATNFSSANFVSVATCNQLSGPNEGIVNIVSQAAGAVRVTTVEGSDTPIDSSLVCVACFGDQ